MLEIDGANIEVLNMNESMKQKKRKMLIYQIFISVETWFYQKDFVLPNLLAQPKDTFLYENGVS
jgi:hypothetical protein